MKQFTIGLVIGFILGLAPLFTYYIGYKYGYKETKENIKKSELVYSELTSVQMEPMDMLRLKMLEDLEALKKEHK